MSLEMKILKKEDILDFKDIFEKTNSVSIYSPFKSCSVDVFKWSFFPENYREAIYITIIDSEKNEIIGTQAGMYIPMRTPDGKVCLTIKSEDTVVNIDGLISYKKRDILKEMIEKIEEEIRKDNIEFIWGFTYIYQSFERVGFIPGLSSQQGVYVINPLKAYFHLVTLNPANKFKQKIQIVGLTLWSFLKFRFNLKKQNIDFKDVSVQEVNEEKLLSFLPKNLYCIQLTKNFLEWRIGSNPSPLKYSILEFSTNNNVISYIIFSMKENSIFFIEQLLFDHNLDQNTKQNIVKTALRYFKQKGAVIVRAIGFDHNNTNKEELEILYNSGFIIIKRGIEFILKGYSEKVNSKKIYLSRLNTQGIY